MSMHLACEQGMMGPTAYDVARPGYRAAGPGTGPPALAQAVPLAYGPTKTVGP